MNALPLEANAIVINAETVCRVQEAVDLKKPLIDKNLTLAGKLKGCDKSNVIEVLMDVPIGREISRILENHGGTVKDYGEIIMGGPFTGKRAGIDDPVIKTTGGIRMILTQYMYIFMLHMPTDWQTVWELWG